MTFRSILRAALIMFLAMSFPLSVFAAPQPSPPQAIADFGVSGMEVRSVKTLDTQKLNAQVHQAAKKGETWTKEAILVALRFVGAGLQGNRKIIDVQTPPEQHHTATITVTASGYLDDAVSGERWRLWLGKGPDGSWTIKRALWAQLCSRPGRRFYSGERCP